MSRRTANPTLIGAFVVGGLALLAVAVIATAGNRLFARKERVVMHFSGSVYGLREGAPVVFRGVEVGNVTSIRVAYDQRSGQYQIPVEADLNGQAVRGLQGPSGSADGANVLSTLVQQRGLSAQLSMQSLLTGQLYVDLDLRPGQPASGPSANTGGSPASAPPGPAAEALAVARDGPVEIPTVPNALQALKNQFDGVNLRAVADDLSAIAASARTLVTGPELKQTLANVAEISRQVAQLSARLDKRIDPLADELQQTLGATRGAMQRVGDAAVGVQDSAGRMGAGIAAGADQVRALLAPGAPLPRQLEQAAAELARTAQALREAAGQGQTLVPQAERTLQDLSRAARALRELSDTLSQQPESVLRGLREGQAK